MGLRAAGGACGGIATRPRAVMRPTRRADRRSACCTRVSEPVEPALWPCFRATCGKGICLATMAAIAFQPRPAEGLKYPNIVRMFEARLARSPHGPALRHKVAGVWRTVTWKQWWDEAREVAAGLVAAHGIAPGDTVAVLSPTRVEWIVDEACAGHEQPG